MLELSLRNDVDTVVTQVLKKGKSIAPVFTTAYTNLSCLEGISAYLRHVGDVERISTQARALIEVDNDPAQALVQFNKLVEKQVMMQWVFMEKASLSLPLPFASHYLK